MSTILEVHYADEAQADANWCASLMVTSDPWITLGLDHGRCLGTLTRPGTELFIARDNNNQRVGCILLAPYGFAGSPYIATIAVTPDVRNMGVGTHLLRFAETHFAERRHLFLLVSSFNMRAQELYSRFGYRQVGELPNYVLPGHAEFIFWKKLA